MRCHPDPVLTVAAGEDQAGTTLVLVRHAETTWGAQGRFAGRQDIPLSNRGRSQLGPLAERIAPLGPDLVLSSPLSRCRQTAAAIAAPIGLPVQVDDGLVDGRLGVWSGHGAAEIARRWPTEFAAWRSDVDATPPDGESFSQIRDRMTAAAHRLVQAHRGKTLVLVSHAAPSKMLFAWALGAASEVAYRMRIDNASVTVIEVDRADRPVLITANDTAHLTQVVARSSDPAR